MDSNRSSDASSSIAEFLEKEKICQDSHKQTEIAGTNSHIDCVVSAHDNKNCSISSDEEIGSLLCQMKELLSPVDLDYLDAHEGRSVEDLLKEARELMRTSPLYNHLEKNSICIDALDNHKLIDSPTSPAKEEYVSQTQNLKDVDCDSGKIDKLMKEMEVLANSSSKILETLNNQAIVVDEKEAKPSICFPSSSLRPSPKPVAEPTSIESVNSTNHPQPLNEANQMDGHSSSSTPTSELSDFEDRSDSHNVIANENERLGNFNDEKSIPIQDSNVQESESKVDVPSKKLLKINTEALSLSDLEVPEKVDSNHSSRLSPPKNLSLNMRNGNDNVVTDSNVQGVAGGTSRISELDMERMQEAYTEEIKRLNLTIELLQLKLAKYEAENMPDCAGDREAVAKDSDGADRLKAEIHTQERLIAGYQKENQRLFQQITAAKDISLSSL
ncbi:uncharacterized protein LOC120350861 isoform X2 [Nilaparvata lugens]|uniref:uncharacterized protein LOC120350861 isoform X2 n=1 Tax=Nilaparvata lugens TaxID=108931 RepID=UPI00193D2B3B|nr:uncharacterized protein LOC120350861 isoform X2 [Nilaparvata lugens]